MLEKCRQAQKKKEADRMKGVCRVRVLAANRYKAEKRIGVDRLRSILRLWA